MRIAWRPGGGTCIATAEADPETNVALNEPVVELDVNPLLVRANDCIAVDALVILDAAAAKRSN